MSLSLTKYYAMNMYPVLKHHVTKTYGWVKIKTYKMIIFFVVLYMRETWSLTLRKNKD